MRKSLQADEIPQSLENRFHIVNRPPGCFSCRHVFGGFFIVIYDEVGESKVDQPIGANFRHYQ